MHSTVIFSPPKANCASPEDDWAEVTDPKEKKRIQNRVAQRTYRQRLKARLAKLSAKVDYHEGRRVQDGRNDSDTPHGGDPDILKNCQVSPFATEAAPSKSKPPSRPVLQLPTPQPSFFEQAMDGDDYLVNTQSINTTPAFRNTDHHQSRSSEFSSSIQKVPEKSGMEYLCFSREPLNDRDYQQLPDFDAQKNNTPTMLHTMNQAELASQAHDYTPENGVMDLFGTVMPSNGPSDGQMAAAMSGTTPKTPESPTTFSKHTSLDERFEWILECTYDTGFDNFDALVTAYYNASFSESSPLSNEQRLSRNRRLPKVVADLSEAAQRWSDWERRGFHEEILKTTETILKSETSRIRNVLGIGIKHLLEAENANVETIEQLILTIKSIIKTELPDLWALMTALATENRTAWQRDISSTVLVSITLLYCAGTVPNEQLVRLVSALL